jgi:hypothetical protein
MPKQCPCCGGTGWHGHPDLGGTRCDICHGTGKIPCGNAPIMRFGLPYTKHSPTCMMEVKL